MQGPFALGVAFLAMLYVCRVHVEALTRTYYLAAVEVDWDYAPKGNVVNDAIETSNKFLLRGQDRVGSIYRKVVYRLYTDARFTVQIRPDEAQGLLGPILRAETGDTLNVVFKNMAVQANRNFSVHPHGVQYNKNAEGALYVDQTTGSDKADDGVGPGRVFTYVWRVRTTFSPTAEDGPCLPWLYHSHVMPTRDVDTGLVGLLLTCKAGTLQETGQRGDVAKEFALYLDTADENNSWLLQNNLNRCGDPAACRQLSQSQNANFVESNQMSHINGRVYGNLGGLEVSKGERVAFYLFSINRGVTSVQFSGQVLNVNNHIVDSIILFPASTVTAITTPSYYGNWLIASRNGDTFLAGQQAYLKVTQAHHWEYHTRIRRGAAQYKLPERMPDPELGGLSSSFARGGYQPVKVPWTRKYYLAIEKYIWDYGPSGQDLFNGVPLTQPDSASAPYFTQGPQRIGGRYIKARYVECTDQTFRVRKARDDTTEHLGMLGPVIMAEVGETVEVSVKNMADRPYSFFPHGVLFTKENEGFIYRDPDSNQTEGRMVLPGTVEVYTFRVPLLAPDDKPCVTHTYHSAVNPVRDIHTGLVGPLLVCSRGQLSQQITLPWRIFSKYPFIRRPPYQSTWFQKHLHLFLNFFTVDEKASWYLDENIANFTSAPQTVNVLDPGFSAANRRHAINGRMFSNLEGLNVCLYENVAWHLFGVGGKFDMHGVNFQGQTLELTGNHISSEIIIPGSALTMTSTPDSKGNWTVSCRTTFHFSTGMTATYRVQDCGANPEPKSPKGVTRRYYIAAQELVWDYAPLKRDSVTGENFTDDSQHGYLYVKDDDLFIGSSYKKALFIEYTDSTFRTRKVRGPREQHLGALGPVIKAEVNDVIEVVFFNNASRAYSMQPQGVRYENTNQNSVAPGSKYTYRWEVPSRAGPGPNDPNCVAWMYFSAVDFVRDTNSGLVGPLLVCKPSTLTSGGSGRPADRRDVDREFWMLYTVLDENQSWYLRENVQTRAPNRTLDRLTEADFMESNRMNSINGLIFGNVDGLVMQEGDVVAWYLLGLGSSEDYHPVHFHGQTFTYRADRLHRGDVMEVFPTTSAAVQMLCDNPGTWIVHCHFSNHVAAGMEAVYTVLPRQYRY